MYKVFIVTYDWMAEGLEILGVFSTLEKAQAFVDNQIRVDPEGYHRDNFFIMGEIVD